MVDLPGRCCSAAAFRAAASALSWLKRLREYVPELVGPTAVMPYDVIGDLCHGGLLVRCPMRRPEDCLGTLRRTHRPLPGRLQASGATRPWLGGGYAGPTTEAPHSSRSRSLAAVGDRAMIRGDERDRRLPGPPPVRGVGCRASLVPSFPPMHRFHAKRASSLHPSNFSCGEWQGGNTDGNQVRRADDPCEASPTSKHPDRLRDVNDDTSGRSAG